MKITRMWPNPYISHYTRHEEFCKTVRFRPGRNSANTLILNIPPFWLKAGISKSSSGILVVAESVFTTSLSMSWAEQKTFSPQKSTILEPPAQMFSFLSPLGAVQTAPAE